jgi:ankyrin repeat protein
VAIETHNIELAVLLLDWGSKPHALEVAIEVGDEHMIRLLLEHGVNSANEVAFLVACESCNGLLLSVLCEAFSSRYPRGLKGFGGKAFAAAILSGNATVLDMLLKVKLGVDSNRVDKTSESRDHLLIIAARCSKQSDLETNHMICQLLNAGADIEAVSYGNTALLQAIMVERLQVVKVLLSKGVNINRPARRRLKRTPLQQACEQGSFKMVEFLLDKGADVHAPPAVNGGATALQLAAIQGSARIFRLLLNRDADIHAASAVAHGRTALEGAAEHGRVSVFKILAEGAAGYCVEEIKSAKAYAEKEGHRGCEERLKLALFRFGEGGGSRLPLSL